MERARQPVAMEAVREEDDEESWDGSQASGDEGGGGIRKKGPNQFDNLCDGVLNAIALVHEELQEFLDLKNELLRHALPPNVLMKIGITSGKVYRRMTDLNEPVNELVRLVRVYSTPWEEKSAALKKLHEDYENKQRQLNVAIKRLQLVDAHSKRIAREKRIMNWEKLFARMTTKKGHGRRWKFLIESVKEKSKLGLEVLQGYLRQLDRSDDEEEDWDDEEDNKTQLITSGNSEPAESDDELQGEEDEGNVGDGSSVGSGEAELKVKMPGLPGEEEEESSDDDADDEAEVDARTESRKSSSKKVTFVEPEKPETSDKAIWTHEPSYDRYLHIRVLKPQGLDEIRDLKCVISYKTEFFKTKILDPLPVESEDEEEKKPKSPPKKKRGLIGTKAPVKEEKKEEKKPKEPPIVFEDYVFKVPNEVAPGVKRPVSIIPEHIKVAVHHGPEEEMFAMATIDLNDIENQLDLPSIIVPPDDPDPDGEEGYVTPVPSVDGNPAAAPFDLQTEKEALIAATSPLSFPLYSIHATNAAGVHMPAGMQPLILFWEKRTQLQVADKKITTASATDLVYELTGIDLRVTSKEDLHPETVEKALSVMSMSPEPTQEIVPKEELEQVMEKHKEEMELLQQEYEARLQELAESLEDLRNNPKVVTVERTRTPSPKVRQKSPSPPPERNRPSSAPKEKVKKPKPVRMIIPHPPTRPKKNFLVGKPLPKWGETLPEDFFERMQVLQDENYKKKKDLHEKTLRDIQDTIERQLATQYKLSHDPGGEMYDALRDVSLPALFMPFKSGAVYNPRAHQYFHPTGSSDVRLSQPPSMLQLPPLPKNKLSVVNLFDLSQNFHTQGPEWLLQQYYSQQEDVPESRKSRRTPMTPAPTMNMPPSTVGGPREGTVVSQKSEPPPETQKA
ncbi:histone-lysine N-methyltransferase SETD1B-A [Lingula anatina]|uniref:Histone-lysine N-methyltransferase SETD1B-A n=1 Tax=Lingula anatina TaxID=7574 RepID=A0A1S3JPE1_LINAN|nr:histone-lysine N-methyltransferase SETD1B-A [Lingula anatina]|eukprot:XP_013412001.1 histone-lysine N-methyltransferase SETD1B-A [Lingula anatina]